MKNLRFNKMSMLGKCARLSVLLCMLTVSLNLSATGSYLRYDYSVTVAPQSTDRGKGKVYIDATGYSYKNDGTTVLSQEVSGSKNGDLYDKNITLEVRLQQERSDENTKPSVEYRTVKLRAESLAGSKFTGWTWDGGSSANATIDIPLPNPPKYKYSKKDNGGTEEKNVSCATIYTAHFTPRTYYYKTLGAKASEGAMVYVCTDGVRPEDSSDKWKTSIDAGTIQSQIADGNGQYGQATITYYIYTKAPVGYYDFIGWYDQNGTEVVLGENGRYDLLATSENSAAPTTIVLTPKFVYSNPYTTITKANLPEVQLYTGVEGTNNVFPYSPKKQIDLSKIFGNDNKALFDSLYIFGETISADGQPLVGEMGAGYPVTYATAIPNAITPCYVYMKSDENTYTLQRTIQNMNPKSTVKPIPDITANGQKLYFTGYCPYASNGVTTQIGVFHIKGGAGAKVDVYLDDLYLYGRAHTSNGSHTFTEAETYSRAAGVDSDAFIEVSSSPFVFSSTSKDTGNPFTPFIHICDSNKLEGGSGYFKELLSGLIGDNYYAGVYSAPIHLYVTDTKQATSLTIDDEWPISTTEKVRTNGQLNLIPTYLGRPCVELGNDNSTLNINGGQLYFKNAVPFTDMYKTTFAIGRRTFKKDFGGMQGMVSGMGEDQPGGNVNFNDGTIYCVPITEGEMNDYPGCYRTTTSMKGPRNTKINGGTLYCDVWACDAAQSIGASPTNQYGDSLVSVRVEINNTPASPYYIATVNFDSLAYASICRDQDNATYFNTSLADYYTAKGGTYYHSSMKADATDSVTLMLPYYFTNKRIFGDETLSAWAFVAPTMKVDASILGELTFGGSKTVQSSSTQTTRYFLFSEVGSNAMSAAGPEAGYMVPDIGLGTVKAWIDGDDSYAVVENEDAYTIQDAQYMFKPIEAADGWMLFSPPFDVTNVYVLETYPEESLKEIPLLYDAYKRQTQSFLDFAFFYCYYIEFMDATSNFWQVYQYWRNDPNLVKGTGAIQLTHFTGNNYDANYYLQRSSGDWDWNETEQKFTTDWQFVTPEQVDHGGTMYNVVMKKGEIYSMKFPYMYYGYSQKTGKWDYWTGKYLIFEGLGTQTIEGKNYHNSIRNILPAPGKAAVRVNSTFATMTPNEDAYVLSQDMETGYQKFTVPNSEDPVKIEPTSGYVMVDHTMPAMSMPGRKAAIDMMSGTVTYEEDDDDFSTPTIAGEHTLLVYTISGGIGVIPVMPQYVSIYNAAGQLITSQYVTDETCFELPSGIYFVCGENDRAKAMVK